MIIRMNNLWIRLTHMNVGKSMFIEEKNDSTQPLSNLNMVDKGRNQSCFTLQTHWRKNIDCD